MTFPKTYMRLSLGALRAMLSARGLPPNMVEITVNELREAKKERRTVAQKRGQHARLWRDLIAPAKAERYIVRRMQTLRVKNPSPERAAALEAYELLLTALINKMEEQAAATPEMPKHVAEERGLPNKGEHWVDWVPSKKKAWVLSFFDAIPYARGVKVKHPFERRIPQTQHEVHKTRLLERTTKEMALVERRMAVELADPKLTDTHYFKHQEIDAMRIQVSRMQAAMHIVQNMKPTDFVPVTWHGVALPQ